MSSTRCLFLSGPIGGRFIRVPDDLQVYVVPLKEKFDWLNPPDELRPTVKTESYIRTTKHVFVHESE